MRLDKITKPVGFKGRVHCNEPLGWIVSFPRKTKLRMKQFATRLDAMVYASQFKSRKNIKPIY